jgi:hypothetical protein
MIKFFDDLTNTLKLQIETTSKINLLDVKVYNNNYSKKIAIDLYYLKKEIYK